jgi:hypothetical protein
MDNEWLKTRVLHLKGLKSPSDQQRLLLALADKQDRTPLDDRKLAALVKAEKAAERAQKARADAARIVNAEKKVQRKARDRELFNAAGLLIMAGLVDTKTGLPTIDRSELLGALLGLAKVLPDDPRRSEWKKAGNTLLHQL